MKTYKYENTAGAAAQLAAAPYIINKIDISEIENNISDSKNYGMDGTIKTGSNILNRTISIELSILTDNENSLKHHKRNLSRLFNPKYSGKLWVDDVYINCECTGSVSYLTGSENRQAGYQKALIELKCLDPYFYSNDIFDNISIWNDVFEFEIELIADGTELGTKSGNLIYNIINDGDLCCGFDAEININNNVTNPYIHNIDTNEDIKVIDSFNYGDKIIISTRRGNKKVDLLRNGVITTLFDKLTLETNFFSLDLGNNNIKFGADAGEESISIVFSHKELFIDEY